EVPACEDGVIESIDKKEGKTMIGKMKIPTPGEKNNIIRLLAKDLNRNAKDKDILRIERGSKNSSQNFLIVKKKNNKPIFHNYVTNRDTLILKTSKEHRNTNLYMDYFNK
ncbi:MAG: hypothetical protein ABEH43_02385, partial [Flavobacteriales bacterium]